MRNRRAKDGLDEPTKPTGLGSPNYSPHPLLRSPYLVNPTSSQPESARRKYTVTGVAHEGKCGWMAATRTWMNSALARGTVSAAGALDAASGRLGSAPGTPARAAEGVVGSRCTCFVPDTLALSGFGGLRPSDRVYIVDGRRNDGNEPHPLRQLISFRINSLALRRLARAQRRRFSPRSSPSDHARTGRFGHAGSSGNPLADRAFVSTAPMYRNAQPSVFA